MAEENNNIEELLGNEENLNKAIAIIKGKSFAVMPIKDFNEQEQNLRKEIGSHFGKELSEIDVTLSEHLGIDKEGNEKTNAFIKRVIPTLKSELDTLKKAKEDGLTGSESLKAERDSLLEKLNTSAKEKEELENNFKTTLTNKDKEFIVNTELSKLSFKEGIESILNPAKKQFIDSVLSKSTLEEGKLVFKEEGVTIRNDKNEPVTVFELASKEFESVLSTDNVIKGLGNGDNTKNNSKSSLSLFAASRKPTNFGEAELTIKAYYESKGERVINGSKKMLQGLSELRKIYKF